MSEGVLEAWKMSAEANRFLLKAIPRGGLACAYRPRARTVAAQFAHMHDVRVRWLAYADPSLPPGKLPAFGRGAEPTKAQLSKALNDSEKTVARFLAACLATGRVRNWDGAPATFLGYLVAHEAHHRGLVLVSLRIAGLRLPQSVVYGLWDWGKKSSLR